MAATLLVTAPVLVDVPVRPARLHRGRHLDRGQRMKLAVVGGGSTYTPELADGLARMTDVLSVDELVLVDPARERTEVVAGVSQRILDRLGARDEGARDRRPRRGCRRRVRGARCSCGSADRTRVPATRRSRSTAAVVGQETTGAGGLAKALRTVPVVLDIAEHACGARARRVDRRLHQSGGHRDACAARRRPSRDRAVQRRDRLPTLVRRAARRSPRRRRARSRRAQSPDLGAVGRVHGRDELPHLLERHLDATRRPRRGAGRADRLLVQSVPSYYLRYFYAARRGRPRAARGAEPRRGRAAHRDANCSSCTPIRPSTTKPELLTRRGGAYYSEAAVALVASLLGGAPGRHVVNVRNEGRLPFLADETVVEVPARVEAGRQTGAGRSARPAHQAGLVAHVSAYESLALDAALRGGRERVVEALLAHPLVGSVRPRCAGASPRRCSALDTNARYLSWT